ncbi:hypothetical protein [Ferroglobus placidus]|uniref:hypothetical protein n=1 Tax=Ferroglobus placidus TaxID=54261 RepID=UPI001B7FD957|nr:hypothetical protein [Ferroglobus placidus]
MIVEVGESSGVVPQGWEALRLGRPLFFWKLLAEKDIRWVKEMMKYGACVLRNINDLKRAMRELVPPPTDEPLKLSLVGLSDFI